MTLTMISRNAKRKASRKDGKRSFAIRKRIPRPGECGFKKPRVAYSGLTAMFGELFIVHSMHSRQRDPDRFVR